MMCRILRTCLVSLLTFSAAAAESQPDSSIPTSSQLDFFEKKVRPLLIERCYKCHSARNEKPKGGLLLDSRDGWAKGGESGPAVVPRKPDESRLIVAVRYRDKDLQMPPKNKLSEEEIAVLVEWVKMGAPDPRRTTVAVSSAKPIDIEKGRKFWAFQPHRKRPVPETLNTDWPRTDIDRFILARIDAAGLHPAPDADRQTLIRRASFDLTGLPPTIEQIDAFLRDRSPDAFEKVVNRLLESKHFGERWGRHWLDVARFAESSGGGRSLMFKNAWRFRDYVIASYNSDKPFNRFISEQVAGDLLPSSNPKQRAEQLAAAGFLALGPTNYEQQDKELLRMEVVDEQIDTMGRAFLGMTLGCARCHDHKFDPIPTADYYALAGIFRSTQTLTPGNVSGYIERELPLEGEQRATWERYQKELKDIEAKLSSARAELVKLGGGKGVSVARTRLKNPVRSELMGFVVDNNEATLIGSWKRSTHTRGFLEDGYIHDENTEKGRKSVTFNPNLPAAGHYEVRISYTPGTNRASNVPVTVHFQGGQKTIRINEKLEPPIKGCFVSLGVYQFTAGMDSVVVISNEQTNGHVIADAAQFIPIVPAAIAQKAKAKTGTAKAEAADSKQLPRDKKEKMQKREAAQALVNRLRAALNAMKQKASAQLQKTMSVRDEAKPGDWHVHIRGGIRNLGAIVPRGFIQVATTRSAPPVIPNEQSGRLELAEWLTNPSNPLPARVYVNRVWHYLFGAGLVRTTDNFGKMGERPSHPDLLDYLALHFIEIGWSTKKLIRAIMLSKVYQQSTAQNSKTAATDPENRLLSHANRRRLDAEAIRDTILFVSGRLDTTQGGLTIRKITQYDLGYQFDTRRRSVYVPFFRNSILEIFEVFDVANPNMVTGRRTTSTLATQALFMMNSPFVNEESKHAAKRLLAATGLDETKRIRLAYRRGIGRTPTKTEIELARQYLESVGSSKQNRLDAWAGLCQTLFACLDFRHLN